MSNRRLCVIPGDGIGPEVTAAAVQVLNAATDDVEIHFAEAGWQTFCDQGNAVPEATLERIRECGAGLFGAVASPARKVPGYRSAILKIRQTLDLFANIRPVRGRWAQRGNEAIDLVVVRENSEGLYGGREEIRAGRAVAEKVVTAAASQRIGRCAATIARLNRFSRITIVHKANVLPLSDGLFRDSAREAISSRDAGLEIEEGLVDIVAHNLVACPEKFQVLVTTNMFGDILSDLAAHWCGGMGRAPGLNLGEDLAVAEPVHGSAPDIAGQGIADPSATILSLALLCRYVWQDFSLADRLEDATVRAIENATVGAMGQPRKAAPLETRRFTERVIENLDSCVAGHDSNR